MTRKLKSFGKWPKKKSQFPLPLILGQNWLLYWDFFSEISNIVLLGGGRKVLWIFCFVTVLDGIVPNCLGKLQLWQLFFPSNLKEKFVFQNAFSPFFLKVSQQFSLSFRTLKVGPIFTPTPCFAWIIAFSPEISSLLRLSQSKHF